MRILETFSANKFALPDVEDNTSRLLNRGGITDLPLLRTLLEHRVLILGSDGLFCFIRM